MKKIISYICLLFLPLVANAAGDSLSFTPPVTDYSVIFLGNIFGVVDGVLHGTGSQILGQMFSVFNAAVLALGGIIIIYTLIVSTLNTANEGQMLGKKWDSMWVPVRATLGLALLVPKASGYCVMQIFVMWIVVQGVGAADKVWNASLDYLNRGGLVVPSMDSASPSVAGSNGETAQGAANILASQVCMLGLEKVLIAKRKILLREADQGIGRCSGTGIGSTMKILCDSPVPSFLNSFNAIDVQKNFPTSVATASLPNFPSTSPYKGLNGICGKVSWAPIPSGSFDTSGLSQDEMQTTLYTRAIAVQQLYVELSNLASLMVNNDPQLNGSRDFSKTSSTSSANATDYAKDQFGYPYANNQACSDDASCVATSWQTDPSLEQNNPILFTGFEFIQAISDYNSIMKPVLSSIALNDVNVAISKAKSFIAKAEQSGWIMAGSYFFNLAQLNALAPKSSSSLTDENSQLDSSQYSDQLSSVLNTGQSCDSSSNPTLCVWMGGDLKSLTNITNLIESDGSLALTIPKFTSQTDITTVQGNGSSSVIGYIRNASQMTLPGQPGLLAPGFTFSMPSLNNGTGWWLKPYAFTCDIKVSLIGWCATQDLGNSIYNNFFVKVVNDLLTIIYAIVKMVVNVILFLPLKLIAHTFQYAVSYIQAPNVNPIVAVANMGVYYINLSTNMFIDLVAILGPLLAVMGVNIIIMCIVALTLPILMAWLTIMITLGFVCAFYIPFVPYMIFTFGTIGWLMAVIESMVAAPIIALGVTHPEGEGPFGKGEQALMILMNVFLRPSMMIIGYIAAIILSYVGIWILNAGFGQVVQFISGNPELAQGVAATKASFITQVTGTFATNPTPNNQASIINGHGYASWAGTYGFFFVILMYTSIYLIIVQRTFTLITLLPDKVLRWIGGQAESYGSDSAQWGEEVKGKIEKAGEETNRAATQTLKSGSAKLLGVAKDKLTKNSSGGEVKAEGKK